MSPVVVEFEGFQLQPHVFIVKELAFFDVNRGYHGRWTFLPPHPWEQLSRKNKKTFSWLTLHCHEMDWDSGELPYTSLPLILTFLFVSYSGIYAKGLEKCKFLESFSARNILDLNDLKCPKIGNLKHPFLNCPDHTPGFHHCALAKASAYGSFIKENLPLSEVIRGQDVKHRASQGSGEM